MQSHMADKLCAVFNLKKREANELSLGRRTFRSSLMPNYSGGTLPGAQGKRTLSRTKPSNRRWKQLGPAVTSQLTLNHQDAIALMQADDDDSDDGDKTLKSFFLRSVLTCTEARNTQNIITVMQHFLFDGSEDVDGDLALAHIEMMSCSMYMGGWIGASVCLTDCCSLLGTYN
eukprot:6155114-Pyramimonas_sp.AAC.1